MYIGIATKHKLNTSGGAKIAPKIKQARKAIFLFFASKLEGNTPTSPSNESTTGTSKTTAKISNMVVRVLK